MQANLHKARALFLHAVGKIPPEQWEDYVSQACGPDAALKEEVQHFLQVHRQAGSFLDQPLFAAAPGMYAEPHGATTLSGEGPGTVLGAYKLLEQIGEGGMGLVFMAEQAQPVRRKVALKILKPGMDTRQIVARFEAERQALALMEHPSIAKVFDAGTTASGRPFFVMELVRGVPVTEFCDQHRYTPRQRLELFITVCQAVQHAHQKGIIHRDLKPSNVLVTLHDTVAVPKIIDFGIAKTITSQALTERTLFTHFAQMLGTPLYMSPEQAEMNGLDIDTRSDVYALGVLLYELLTGTTPSESETLKKVGLDEMRRIIREDEPPRPSDRVSTLEAAACTTVSARRGMDERRLAPLLRGELDWIVMKALDKDRNRRYESASALAADVQRYLQDEPVQACPPSAGYRVRKFVRRNRRLVGMVGVIALVLVAATSVSAWQAVLARDAQHQAETDRDRMQKAEMIAASEAEIAKAVSDFLQNDLLGQAAGPSQLSEGIRGDVYITVKEALDKAAARVGHRFKHNPLLEAAILTTIGTAYNRLHSFPQAIPPLERAVALRRKHLGASHQETLNSIGALAIALRYVGRHEDHIALRKAILELRKADLSPDHPEVQQRVADLAYACWAAGEWDTAELLLNDLLIRQSAALEPAHGDIIGTKRLLAMTYQAQQKRPLEVIELYKEVVNLRTFAFGAGSREVLYSMFDLARAYQDAGEFEHSENKLGELLPTFRNQEKSPGNQLDTANLLGWLARALAMQKKFAEAEAFAREATKTNELYSPDGLRHYEWMSLWGGILLGLHDYKAAESLLLEGYEGLLRCDIHPKLAPVRAAEAAARLVQFYDLTNQPDKAQAWREKATVPP